MKKSHYKAKKYLMGYQKMENAVKMQLLEVSRLKALTTNISVSIGEKVQTSAENKLEKQIIKLVEEEEKADKLIKSLVERKNMIARQINELDGDDMEYCVEVLTRYFVYGENFAKIATEISMSERNVYNVYNKALSEFEKKYWEFL